MPETLPAPDPGTSYGEDLATAQANFENKAPDYSNEWWNQPAVEAGSSLLAATGIEVEEVPEGDTTEQIENANRALDAGEGWKLYVNFDAKNEADRATLQDRLDEIKSRYPDLNIKYKIGESGGADAGSPGKEATIYIGDMQHTMLIAEVLDQELTDILVPQIGVEDSEVMIDSVPFTDLIWGRFSVEHSQKPRTGDDRLQMYTKSGPDGIPMTQLQVSQGLWGGEAPSVDVEKTLQSEYGSFFENDTQTYQELLRRKQDLLDAQNEKEPGEPLAGEVLYPEISRAERDRRSQELVAETRAWLSQIENINENSLFLVQKIGDEGKNNNGGTLRASIMVADAINSNTPAHILEADIIGSDGYPDGSRDCTAEEYDMLIETAPNQGLRILAKLMKSAAYPAPENPNGLVELQPRDPDQSRQIRNHGSETASDAILCGRAEAYFGMDVRKLTEIEQDGKVVAYQKHLGENTAVLAADAIINGVELPKGTLVTVEEAGEGEYKFGYARLSAFSFDSPQEMEAAAPYLSAEHNFVSAREDVLELNKLLGNEVAQSVDAVEAKLKSIQERLEDDRELQRVASTIEMYYDRLQKQDSFDASIRKMWEDLHRYNKENIPERPDISGLSPEERDKKMAQYDDFVGPIYDELENMQRNINNRRQSNENPQQAFSRVISSLQQTFGVAKVEQARKMRRDKKAYSRILERVRG